MTERGRSPEQPRLTRDDFVRRELENMCVGKGEDRQALKMVLGERYPVYETTILALVTFRDKKPIEVQKGEINIIKQQARDAGLLPKDMRTIVRKAWILYEKWLKEKYKQDPTSLNNITGGQDPHIFLGERNLL